MCRYVEISEVADHGKLFLAMDRSEISFVVDAYMPSICFHTMMLRKGNCYLAGNHLIMTRILADLPFFA
jgi:hypothetical protein